MAPVQTARQTKDKEVWLLQTRPMLLINDTNNALVAFSMTFYLIRSSAPSGNSKLREQLRKTHAQCVATN